MKSLDKEEAEYQKQQQQQARQICGQLNVSANSSSREELLLLLKEKINLYFCNAQSDSSSSFSFRQE